MDQLLPASSLSGNPWEEALHHNNVSPVLDQVCFKLDFSTWRSLYSDRKRDIMDRLLIGERTGDVSRRLGLSPARVSQLRREFRDDWSCFWGDRDEVGTAPTSI